MLSTHEPICSELEDPGIQPRVASWQNVSYKYAPSMHKKITCKHYLVGMPLLLSHLLIEVIPISGHVLPVATGQEKMQVNNFNPKCKETFQFSDVE